MPRRETAAAAACPGRGERASPLSPSYRGAFYFSLRLLC